MILIIDDDSAVRSSLSFMLKRAGYEAQTVPGPREAMEVVRSIAPDLILMDMNFTLSTYFFILVKRERFLFYPQSTFAPKSIKNN